MFLQLLRVKKLHRLIIATYLGPFLISFFVTLFILVMQFLWKYIDELVGKGLEWYTLSELLFYASANLVPMALPLAILISSIMTFGNLGEHYELVAMKSSGMSLQKIMLPLIGVAFFTSVAAFYFSNNVWPVANLKFASLLYDIRHKKPTIDIKTGLFYSGIDGYVIRVGDKDKDGKTMSDILIYDHTEQNGGCKVLFAEKGTMQMSEDEMFLILSLYNGASYEEVRTDKESKGYKPLFRSKFKEQVLRFDLTGFKLSRSDEELFKDNYQMMNLSQLDASVDTLQMKKEERMAIFSRAMNHKFALFRDSTLKDSVIVAKGSFYSHLDTLNTSLKNMVYESAINHVRSTKSYVNSMVTEMDSRTETVTRHEIEWHRKFTLSIACLVLFFIGAPLGAIIRKGGLGLPVIISVFFFLIFHIMSITGEKLAKEGEMSAMWGMWLASFCLLPVGAFLTYKSTTDSPLLDMDAYFRVADRIKTRFRKNKHEDTTAQS